MQASDLIGRIAVVMKTCGEEVLMSHLGVVLYEYLGEEYPEVLGSILGALKVGCSPREEEREIKRGGKHLEKAESGTESFGT